MLLEVNDAQYTNVHKLVQTPLNVSLYDSMSYGLVLYPVN